MKICVNRKVLIISYHFPPDAQVGSIRPAKFCKYLKRFGWHPYVLTVKEEFIHIKDKDYKRMCDVNGIPIYRTDVWPTVLQILLRIWCAFVSFISTFKKTTTKGLNQIKIHRKDADERSVIKRYMDSLFEFPDKQIGWLIPCVWQAYRIIKKENIKIVITTSPPRTVSLIGLILKKILDVMVIADFRDPWFLPMMEPKKSQTILSKKLGVWLEYKIMKSCDLLVTTTEHYRNFLQQHYNTLQQDKFQALWNGYDPEDFRDFEQVEPDNNKFILSYLGTFYMERSPESMLMAIRELIDEGKIPISKLYINLIGDVSFINGRKTIDIVKNFKLEDCIKIESSIPLKKSILIMKKSHVLLLFAPNQYYAIPAKAFEYLNAGRRILCFANDGATSDLIRKTDSGLIVNQDNVKEIKDALIRLYLDYQKGCYKISQDSIREFNREHLTRKLAKFIENMQP